LEKNNKKQDFLQGPEFSRGCSSGCKREREIGSHKASQVLGNYCSAFEVEENFQASFQKI